MLHVYNIGPHMISLHVIIIETKTIQQHCQMKEGFGGAMWFGIFGGSGRAGGRKDCYKQWHRHLMILKR